LIGPDGVIREVWRQVDPTTTMAETYEAAIAHMGD
jgi:peroxiredoxin